MTAIFDYGAGNLRSVQNTLGELGYEYELVSDSAGLRKATRIILPGVGHFSTEQAPERVCELMLQHIGEHPLK